MARGARVRWAGIAVSGRGLPPGPLPGRPVSAPVQAALDVADRVEDPREPLARLFRNLRTCAQELSSREAARRLVVHGANELSGQRRPPLAG